MSRVQGTFVHPNPFATFLVILAVIALAVLPHLEGGWRQLSALVVFGAASGVTVLTYARGAWIALVLGVIVIGICQDRRLLVGLVLGIAVVVVAVPSVTSRLSDLNKTRVEGRGDPNSLAWRVSYWERLVPLTARNPVTGIGLEQVLATQPEKLQPHNVFVQTLVETGLLGFVCLGGLCIAMARDLRRAIRSAPGGLSRGVAVGAAAAALGLFFQLGSENLLTQAAIHWYLAVPLAWAFVATSSGGRVAHPEGAPPLDPLKA